ncbi:hypothetical protein G6O69_38235 [Pseudenhygromyxa sp. WMMC2535]|nr:hypothetical protein [Pseudenhygromyxa sp. WMMC2535]
MHVDRHGVDRRGGLEHRHAALAGEQLGFAIGDLAAGVGEVGGPAISAVIPVPLPPPLTCTAISGCSSI